MPKAQKGQSEFVRWMPALLDGLRGLGGSAKPREVIAWIEKTLDVPKELVEFKLKSGQSRFYNQVHWARQYLVWQGLIDDSKRGTWKLTQTGWKAKLSSADARALFLQRVKINQKSKDAPTSIGSDASISKEDELPPLSELQQIGLLEVLQSLPPYGFELICERLLREHGFENVKVTSKSKDGGIDGFGVLRLSPFVAMKVAFQAKRYKGSVSRQQVGQFRNDFIGKAEKGVLITTGRFTADAESEAIKAGAVPIELVDGQRLVELFEDKQLGVQPKQIFEIEHAFFDQFRDK